MTTGPLSVVIAHAVRVGWQRPRANSSAGSLRTATSGGLGQLPTAPHRQLPPLADPGPCLTQPRESNRPRSDRGVKRHAERGLIDGLLDQVWPATGPEALLAIQPPEISQPRNALQEVLQLAIEGFDRWCSLFDEAGPLR